MNKKLHILFLSSWYPSKVMPVNGDFVQRHAESVRLKHRVTVVHVITDNNLKEPIKYTESIINKVITIIIYVRKSNVFLKNIIFLKLYLRTIKKIGHFDIVHLNICFPVGLVALYLKRFQKKNYLITEHWTGYQYPNNTSIGFFKKWLTRIIVKNASFVCPVSENLKNQMVAFGLKGNYFPVPNVVDVSLFIPSEKVPQEFTITHISHMGNAHKNIIGILKVISKLQAIIPNLKLQLIGDNSRQYLPEITRLKIGNVVNVIDQVSHQEIVRYLKKSSVFVLFSNYENLPCVILESFACNVPVVSTNVGGISEFFPSNFGYLVPAKNEQEFEKAILKVYRNELEYDENEMHQYAKINFASSAVCNLFSDLYAKILMH